MVEGVEALQPELGGKAFTDLRVLEEGEVGAPEAGTPRASAARGTITEQTWRDIDEGWDRESRRAARRKGLVPGSPGRWDLGWREW